MIRSFLGLLARWVALAFLLHGVWEVAHLPLYTLWDDPDRWRVMRYVLHCLAGDALIAATTYLLTAIVFRDIGWPWRRPWPAGAFLLALGLVFTAASEWYNVYVLGAWSYAPAMPTMAGIGLTPLLQWLVVPVAMILVLRRFERNSREEARPHRKSRSRRR